MDHREAYHIARSVAKWTWNQYTGDSKDLSDIQRKRRTGSISQSTAAMLRSLNHD
jgi:hypothetical protein